MSRLDEWCSNLFRILTNSAGGSEPARMEKKTETEEDGSGGGRGGSSGGGNVLKAAQPKTAPSPFNNSTGGGF